MDIFFQDPNEVPLPPDEVRIRELRGEPAPDGVRVRVFLELDPFQKRPNADIVIIDPAEKEASTVSIIETMNRKMEMTMHLRGERPEGEYIIRANLYYSERPVDAAENQEPEPAEIKIVDQAEARFRIGA